MMSDKQTYDEKHNQPQRYEIRIKGHLDDRWADLFEGLAITLEDNGNTLLSGPVTGANHRGAPLCRARA
jgi:hypothetical protein